MIQNCYNYMNISKKSEKKRLGIKCKVNYACQFSVVSVIGMSHAARKLTMCVSIKTQSN